MDKRSDIFFMRRALDLASKGIGLVSPNPLVGCVIVHNEHIIGEGWHQRYGEAHAEVNAINSVQDKSKLAQSTVYVTLEPCTHYGKTPPCSDLLIDSHVKRVVIANKDPHPLVNGGGISLLKKAGIQVDLGILEKEGFQTNKRFFTAIEKKRPYVILKWAQTSDGFIARENFDSKWISNPYSRKLVHKWRAEEDAILVGSNTVRYDNPQLNVRNWQGSNPTRLFIDRNLKLTKDYNINKGPIASICYNTVKDSKGKPVEYIKINSADITKSVLKDLHHRKIQSVIIEGGSSILNEFIRAKAWDEARIFISQNKFGHGISAPQLKGKVASSESIENDLLNIYASENN